MHTGCSIFSHQKSLERKEMRMVRTRIIIVLLLCTVFACSICAQPCIPAAGKTALVIGQDYGSILNYTTGGFGHAKPFGTMTYISLRTPAGLLEPADYGSGVQWVSGLSGYYPNSSIQVGLWLVGDTKKVTSGNYDGSIEKLVNYMGSTGEQYYLRIGYEFDSALNNYPVDRYKKAFRYIVTRFRAANVTNVAFVWHASGFPPRDGYNHMSWFPGAEYVDWCGVSLFQQPYDAELMQPADAFAELCKSHNLPLMIAESTPFGGILDEPTARKDPDATNRAGYADSTWSRWFVPVLAYIQRHDVRMWSYINCDWDAQPMWAKLHAPGIYWGDSRVEVHKDVLQRWKVDVLYSSRFIRSYESALKLVLCENIPHKATAYYSANFLRQVAVSLFVFVVIVYLGYRCRVSGEIDHSDDIVYHH